MSGAERSNVFEYLLRKRVGGWGDGHGFPNQIISIAIQRHRCIAVSCVCWSCAVAVKAKVLYCMTDFLASACSPKVESG